MASWRGLRITGRMNRPVQGLCKAGEDRHNQLKVGAWSNLVAATRECLQLKGFEPTLWQAAHKNVPATPDGFADSCLASAKPSGGFFLAMLTNEISQLNGRHNVT